MLLLMEERSLDKTPNSPNPLQAYPGSGVGALLTHQRRMELMHAESISKGCTCKSLRALRERRSSLSAWSRPSVRRCRWRSMLPKPPNDRGLWVALASPTFTIATSSCCFALNHESAHNLLLVDLW